MKRTALIILISCILAGCNSGSEIMPEAAATYAAATAPDAPQPADGTKAYLCENMYRFYWAAGDEISVVTGSENKKFELTDGADSSYGGFYCPGDVLSGHHYAVYPFDGTASVVGDNLKISYPRILRYDAAHHCAGANTMVADGGNGLDFRFSNACSIIRFSLAGTGKLSAIEITSIEGAPLSGEAMIRFTEGGVPSITMADGEPKVKVDFGPEGFQLNPAEQFIYVSLPPAQLREGVRVLFISEGYSTVSKNISIASLPRSSILEMNSLILSDDGFVDLSVKNSAEAGLDITQTANCYLVREPGRYKFPARFKGNSLENVGIPSKAKVVWETLGTSEAPAAGSLVMANLVYNDGFILIDIPSPLKEGNALVAVTDDKDNVLWSWHLWLTAATFTTKSFSGYYVMDRNLGASAATSESGVAAFGLFYQWGRKDPFPGSAIVASASPAAMTGTAVKAVAGTDATRTLDYSIKNPASYINTGSADWLAVSDDTLWDVEKTLYDPCPPGYSLPGKDWTSSFASTAMPWSATSAAFGRQHSASGFWFPAAGKYSYHSATGDLAQTINQVGTQGRIWSASPNEGAGSAYGFGFDASGISKANSYNRSCAYSVRCAKD